MKPLFRMQGSGRAVSRRWLRVVTFAGLTPFALWGTGALAFGSWPASVQAPLAIAYVAAHLVATVWLRPARAVAAAAALFAVPLSAFFLMRPSNDRDWLPEVSQTPRAVIEGDHATVYNVRNNYYDSLTSFTARYETRFYDLSRLRSLDVILTDWGAKGVAHTMVSFGFEGDDYLCFSFETRKEIGETYSAVKGFFRSYELICIAGDERDLLGLRTNHRKGESVYLYRARVLSKERLRNGLLEYLRQINELADRPKWYNALTSNCMTSAFRLARRHAAPGRGQIHWSLILNGYADRHGYDRGVIDTSLPFEQLKQISRINDRAREAGNAPDFSQRIRSGMPGMDWRPPLELPHAP